MQGLPHGLCEFGATPVAAGGRAAAITCAHSMDRRNPVALLEGVFFVSKRVILTKPRGMMAITGRSLQSNRRGGCYSDWKSPIKQATGMRWEVMSWHCEIFTWIFSSKGPGWSVIVDNKFSV